MKKLSSRVLFFRSELGFLVNQFFFLIELSNFVRSGLCLVMELRWVSFAGSENGG